jgi:cytidylate kinase
MQNNYVITIGRELGSGGKAIAQIIGQALNIPVYDSHLINLAAKESGINPKLFEKADEVTNKGFLATVVRGISAPFTSLENFYGNSISNDSLFEVQANIIRKKAETENCIIVGRCADYVLREHPRHLSIFVRANYDDRVKFVSDRNIISREKAKDIIEKTDNQRSEYHDFYSETNWGDSRAYDLCVNSSILGIEKTAEFLLYYAKKALDIQ